MFFCWGKKKRKYKKLVNNSNPRPRKRRKLNGNKKKNNKKKKQPIPKAIREQVWVKYQYHNDTLLPIDIKHND